VPVAAATASAATTEHVSTDTDALFDTDGDPFASLFPLSFGGAKTVSAGVAPAARSSGTPTDDKTASTLEQCFGIDLGDVFSDFD
jgi:hypothetical protein